MSTDERYTKSREEKFLQVLAKELNLTYDELCELEPFIKDNTGYDDQIHWKTIKYSCLLMIGIAYKILSEILMINFFVKKSTIC